MIEAIIGNRTNYPRMKENWVFGCVSQPIGLEFYFMNDYITLVAILRLSLLSINFSYVCEIIDNNYYLQYFNANDSKRILKNVYRYKDCEDSL